MIPGFVDTPPSLVMELASQSLNAHLESIKGAGLSLRLLVTFAGQVAEAMVQSK